MENLNGKNLCNPHDFMRHRRNNGSVHKGIMVLKKNVAWMGCPNKPCKHEVAIKQCSEHEFHVQKTLKSEFPTAVPKVYGGTTCGDGKFYMYSEYIRNGTVKKRKSDPKIGTILQKVFLVLKRIHEKHPNFRHNDLHTDNVLVDGDRPLLFDFGFSNLYGNPIFDEKLKTDYGIFPGNHPMYDFHFFANSVYSDLPVKYKNMVLKVFPTEYLGETTSKIKNGRLRYDVDHKGLPTMDQVIRAFASTSNKSVLSITGPVKKTKVTRTPPKKMSPRVKFSLANKRRASNRKANLIAEGMNEINAELKAIKNIEKLKLAGLLTPSPSPVPLIKRKNSLMAVAVSNTGKGKHIRFTSPVTATATRVRRVAAAGPSRPAPIVTYTNTPRTRTRINKKLCTSYKKDELMNVMRRLGHRVDKRMTLKEMCKKLVKPVTVYKRPIGSPLVNIKKKTYPSLLKKNLVTLAKSVNIRVLSKNKKGDIVNKLYAKLNQNIANALTKKVNKKTVTARQLAETLAKNYGWKNNRHVERVRLLKIYINRM